VPVAGAKGEPEVPWEYRSIWIKATSRSRGTPRLYRLTSDAGRWIESKFCDKCGTTVDWTLEFLPDNQEITGGTFDSPPFCCRLEPYVIARSKPAWLAVTHSNDVCQATPN